MNSGFYTQVLGTELIPVADSLLSNKWVLQCYNAAVHTVLEIYLALFNKIKFSAKQVQLARSLRTSYKRNNSRYATIQKQTLIEMLSRTFKAKF